MELTSKIRQQLQPMHDAIEQTSLAQAIMQGHVTRPVYAQLLLALEKIHQTLESQLQSHETWGLYQSQPMDRAEVIATDLQTLAVTPAPSPQAMKHVEAWHKLALMPRDEQNCWLIGALYVLEGSRMGSRFLARSLAQAFGVPAELGQGIDYHLQGQDDGPKRWKIFKQSLDQRSLSPAQQKALIDGATDTMAKLLDLYGSFSRSSLEPQNSSLAESVS